MGNTNTAKAFQYFFDHKLYLCWQVKSNNDHKQKETEANETQPFVHSETIVSFTPDCDARTWPFFAPRLSKTCLEQWELWMLSDNENVRCAALARNWNSLTQVSSTMDRLSLLLIDGTQVGPFVQQQLHHLLDKWKKLWKKRSLGSHYFMKTSSREGNICRLTSWNPLWAAWCRAVLPVRSAMFRLLSWVSRASAQRVARLAAATCSGVCQNLSRAFASAPRLSSRPTAL